MSHQLWRFNNYSGTAINTQIRYGNYFRIKEMGYKIEGWGNKVKEGTFQGSDGKRKQSVMSSDDRERKKQKAISWGVVLIFSKNGKGGA